MSPLGGRREKKAKGWVALKFVTEPLGLVLSLIRLKMCPSFKNSTEFSVTQALIVLCSLYFSVTFFLFCDSTLYSFLRFYTICPQCFQCFLSPALSFIPSFLSSRDSLFLIIRCLFPLFCFHRPFLPVGFPFLPFILPSLKP